MFSKIAPKIKSGRDRTTEGMKVSSSKLVYSLEMSTAKATTKDSAAQPAAASKPYSAGIILIAGWMIPGLGHLMQGKWIRAVLLFVSITCMFSLGLAMHGKIYSANTGELLEMLGFIGDLGNGILYVLSVFLWMGAECRAGCHRGLRHQVYRRGRTAELYFRRGCAQPAPGEEELMYTPSHFTAVLLFALFTSVVFGITQRSETRAMIRYGVYCFCLFVLGTIAASWAMWLIKH